MKTELIYVELTTGTNHDETAWIGYGQFNRTKKTVYFNGRIFGRGRSRIGNFVDIISGEEVWISGVKKNGEDRHVFGHGKIIIDRSAIEEYLEYVGEKALPTNKFIIADLDNQPKTELANEVENRKLKD